MDCDRNSDSNNSDNSDNSDDTGHDLDSHEILWDDSERCVDKLMTFMGGRDRASGFRHPGPMISTIYSAEIQTDAVLKEMIEDACALANRSVVLGTSNHSDEPSASKISKRSSDRDKSRVTATCPVRHRIDRLLETLYYLQQAVKTSMVSFRLVKDLVSSSDTLTAAGARVEISDDQIAAGVERFSRMELEEANRLQNLLLYLLNSTQSMNLRRNGTDVYQKIFTQDGSDTHAWERIQSIKEFVYESARKEVNFDQWLNLTSSSGNAGSAAEHLTQCYDIQFPKLERDRHVFSFANGVYLAEDDEFVPYQSVSGRIAPSIAACKFFDAQFDDFQRPGYEDWYDIPTPSLQRILDHQEFPPDVCRWMYILIGRLIYNVNEHDGWQVIPYLMGQAGSGKSSILVKVCRNLYELGDVGVLSNNLERKFGLSAFADKYLFIAPEIKHDLQLEQAEFQSLVSGEAVQLNIKFKTAVTVDWVTPGIMAGNEFPNFKNNSGSIDRRVVVFEFINSVTTGDMELGKKLEAEMPALIKKSNMAYRKMMTLCGRNDVWMHLPRYFKERRKELAETTNTLADFVSNGPKLQGGPEAYILLDAFKDAYREFCTKNHYAFKKLHESDLRSELRKYFPTVMISKKACHVWPIGCGVNRSGTYIETVGWCEDNVDRYDFVDDILDRHTE